MKKLFLFIIVTLQINCISQSINTHTLNELQYKISQTLSTYDLADSSYSWDWNKNTSSWVFNLRVTYEYNNDFQKNKEVYSQQVGLNIEPYYKWVNHSYNTNGSLLYRLCETWDGNNWANWARDSYTYDSNNNNLSFKYETYNTSTNTWRTEKEETNTFDSNNNKLTYTLKTWNTSTSTLNNMRAENYIYDSNNNRIQSIVQSWNNITNNWVNSTKSTSTFDSNNNNNISNVSQSWNTTTLTWKNQGRDFLLYNSSNENIQTKTEQWDVTTSNYKNSSIIYLTYQLGNLIKVISTHWNPIVSNYQNNSKDSLIYNSNNQILMFNSQKWKKSNVSWINKDRVSYTYGATQNDVKQENWDTISNSWRNDWKGTAYHHSVTGINNLELLNSKINIYPNPVHDKINILNNGNIKFTEYSIYDIKGNCILKGSINSFKSEAIPVNNIGKGIYFIELRDNKTKVVKKFLID